MAPSIALQINENSNTTSQGSRTSASFTPPANSELITFAVAGRDNHVTARNWTISDSLTGSWTSIAESTLTPWGPNAGYNTRYALNVRAWRQSIGASPSARTVTVDASTNSEFYALIIYAITGHNTSSPLAQAAVANNVQAATEGDSSLSLTLTLGSAPTSGNMVIAMFGAGADSGGGFATPTGYTALTNQNLNYCPGAVFYHTSTTTAAVTCSDLGQVVGNGGGIIIEIAAAAGGYAMDAESGSYTVTGQATALTVARQLAAESGGYTVTGQEAGVAYNRALAAESGSYSIAGQDADLIVSRLLNAESGSYTLTGQDAAILVSRVLQAESGSYTVSGQDATLTYSGAGGPTYSMTAESGSYSLTGQTAVLLITRLLNAESGAYAITGQDAGLIVSRILQAESGAYTLTGQDASLLVSRLLSAESGSYTISGQPVTLVYSGAVVPEIPVDRVFVVPTENRVYVIVAESRTYVIPAENRTFVIE